MATSFEEFIQLELPKRPFLESDVAAESIIVRRGLGPRQLDAVSMADGEILVKRNGILVSEALNQATASVAGVIHAQSTPETTWVIPHDKDTRSVVITILDSTYKAIIADEVQVATDSITINFLEPQAGHANVIFL